MDSLPYADAIIKEYLLFRGLNQTLQAFNAELSTDCGCQAAGLTEMLFRQLIPGLDLDAVVAFLELLNARWEDRTGGVLLRPRRGARTMHP